MGACSSKRKNDEFIIAHYQQLIDDIYKSAESSITKKVPIKEGTSLQLKALLEFLENNQIRLPDALKEIERRIVNASDEIPLETSLLIFIGITETINRHLTRKEIELDEDGTQTTESNIQLDHYMFGRIIQTKQQMLTCITQMVESIHLPKIFSQFLNFFKAYAQLQKIHYDPQLRRIVRFFQELVYQYLQPHMEPGNIHSHRLPESSSSSRSPIRRFTKSAFQVQRQRETSINRIACDLTQAKFIESFNFYVSLLEMVDLHQKHQSSLFRSETESQIFTTLLNMYGQGKFDLDSDDKEDFLQQFAEPFLRLLKLIQERSQNHENEFIDTVLLHFQKEFWIQTHKIERLLHCILVQKPSDPLYQAILKSLTEQTQRSLLEMRHHGVSSHLDQSLQFINEMPTKQFSHYLTESGCDNSQFITMSQQSVSKSRSIVFPNQSLLIIKSAIKCLHVLLSKMKIQYFQTESCIQVLMKAIVAAQQYNYLDLSLQSRQTFNFLMSNIVMDIDNFLNVIYQMLAFTQILLSSEDEEYLTFHHDHDVPEEYDQNAERILRVTLILDMVLESLALVDVSDRKHQVDDELIYSLMFIFERGTSAVQRRVISIVTKIITNVQSEYCMSAAQSQIFRVSDSGAILFVIQFFEHENNSVRRGLANNNSVFVLVNVILYLGQQQNQVIITIASHLRQKLLISVDDLATRIFTLTIYSICLLSLGLAIPQLGNVKQITKSMLNDILHFNLQDRLKWLPKLLDIDFPKPILDVDIILDRYRKRDWDTHLEEIEIKQQTSRASPFSTKNYLSAPSMRLESQQNFDQMCQHMQRNQQRQQQIFNEDRWLL